jgi:putative redox protein
VEASTDDHEPGEAAQREGRRKTDSKDDRVVVRTGTGLRTDIMADGYTLVADEPVGVGGTDAGPTPYDYLLAALGPAPR